MRGVECPEKPLAKPLATPRRLRAALDGGELVAHYQPILDLRAGQWSRAEALARWEHPTAGVIAAGEFVPVAEGSGLIGRLGVRMLDMVLADAIWEAGPPGTRVSVNMPVSELREGFAESLLERLDADGVSPERLVIEVTESQVMQHACSVRGVIGDLRERGVRVVLDDFGTGYSSLARLASLPIHGFKLDRRFIFGIEHSVQAQMTVKAVVAIARAHDLATVAEGIETQEALEVVSSLGCDFGQGFHLARPMSAADARAAFGSPVPLASGKRRRERMAPARR